MKVLKVYKRSIKFLCRKCGYPVMAVKGSNAEISGTSSPCIEGARCGRMDWPKWRKGMKKKAVNKC